MPSGRLKIPILILTAFLLGYFFQTLSGESVSKEDLRKARALYTHATFERLISEILYYRSLRDGMLDYSERNPEFWKKSIEVQKRGHRELINELSGKLEFAMLNYGSDVEGLKEPAEEILNQAALVLYE